MNRTFSMKPRVALIHAKRLAVCLLAVCILSLMGCGSTTKVYNTDKTILYKGDLYNMRNVQRISPQVNGKLPNGDVKDMKGMDKKAIQALLDESSPIMVSMIVEMDSKEMVYERKSVRNILNFPV